MSEENKTPQEPPKDLDIAQMVRWHKRTIVLKIKAGEVNLSSELIRLNELEKELKKQNTPPAESTDGDNEIGLPKSFKIKRPYTLSPEALGQRRAAAKSGKKTEAMRGNNNSFRHGRYASSFLNKLQPCLSTCEQYPCDLVREGATKPGKQCLDKYEILSFFGAVHKAIKDKRFDDFNELAALQISNTLKVLDGLLADIIREGGVIMRPHFSEGRETHKEPVLHPALLALPKLIADLGLNPSEFLITPRAIAREKTDKKAARTLADMMSGIGRGKRTEDDE